MMHTDIAVIGSGPAGSTAAIYAARAMRNPLVIAGLTPGGQLTITTDVENYPGFADVVQGPWLVEQMRLQALRVGTNFVEDMVAAVDVTQRPFQLQGDSGLMYTCDALIIATGSSAKWLGLETERKFRGFGVSACATCDGFFFRAREVVVVGGGNTAVEEALYLTNFATRVTLIHRRSELRAERVLQDRLFRNPKIEVLWDTTVEKVLGKDAPLAVTGIVVRDLKTGTLTQRPTDGVFVAIGHVPATELFRDQLVMRENGYLFVEPGSTRTSVPGVFAAGDVADDSFRQAVTAAGLGCMAALEADRWLSENADFNSTSDTMSSAHSPPPPARSFF